MTLYVRKTQNAFVDVELIALAAEGKVFAEGFEPKQLSGCAYDLRAGDTLTSRQRSQQFDLAQEAFVLEPGEVATIQTIERLNFGDPLCYSLIFSSHTQLSQGLFHPTTSVDPGFTGPLTITVINVGNTGYTIRRGERIAKMITSPVSPQPERIYGKGQKPRVAEGSIDHSLVVMKAPTAEDDLDEEDFFGGPLGKLAERIRGLEDNAELHRTSKENRRMRFWLLALWTIIIAITGGTVTRNGDAIWRWIKGIFNIP